MFACLVLYSNFQQTYLAVQDLFILSSKRAFTKFESFWFSATAQRQTCASSKYLMGLHIVLQVFHWFIEGVWHRNFSFQSPQMRFGGCDSFFSFVKKVTITSVVVFTGGSSERISLPLSYIPLSVVSVKANLHKSINHLPFE